MEEEGELVLNPEDTQMVASLTERLVRSIRVEQSVVRNNNFFWFQFNLQRALFKLEISYAQLSLLGTILQIFKTAGHLGQVNTMDSNL